MNGLADLLRDPTSLVLQVAAQAPSPRGMQRAAAASATEVSSPSAEDVSVLQARVAQIVAVGAVGTLSRRDLRESCKTFLHPPQAPGRDASVGGPLIDEVHRLKRKSAFLALINAYLDGFTPGDQAITRLGSRLAALNENWPWNPSDPWPHSARQFALFDPDRGPILLAKAVLEGSEAPAQIMDQAGLTTDARRFGGLGQAAFSAACHIVSERRGQASTTYQARLIQWARLGDRSLAYPGAWIEFLVGLVKPWSGEPPDTTHRGRIIDLIISIAGDPRINLARWRPVREVAPAVFELILKWLTRASIEQFFDIVGETMTSRPDMWRERREFWTGYLREEKISEAWVAFGADGVARAERAARQSNEAGLSMFGRLASDSKRTPQHAALIMKIGDLTIVEWSHSGSWNVWPASPVGHPVLYRHNKKGWPDYSPSELMGGPINGAHHVGWQSRVARIIENETGIRR